MWVIGHRGAPRLAVENSLAALQIAMDEGADGVELDVQCCGDGEWVVVHDTSLLRLAGEALDVPATPWRVLRDLRLRAAGLAPQPLAHLDAVLEWCANQPWRMNFELKFAAESSQRHIDATVARFARRAATAWHPHWLVSSFSRRALHALETVAPQMRRAALVADPADPWWPLAQTDTLQPAEVATCQQIHPHLRLADAARLTAWHAAQWPVWTWTVNHPHEIEQMAQWHRRGWVQAVITDDPAGVRRRCERH